MINSHNSGLKDFIYVNDLTEGWCAITDRKNQLGMGLVFPKEIFTSLWLFLTYGGWRNLYTAILEPCTAYPKDLETAIRTENCGHIEPLDVMQFETLMTVYTGRSSVERIDSTGKVY
jgi:hypothetical protein